MANAGEYRFNGGWGSAWDASGNVISEMVEVATTVQIGRIDVPLVGTMRVGHKTGRETREGTMRVQKIDAKWELQVYAMLSQSVQAQRAARDGQGTRFNPEFSLMLKYDDPEALGPERWQITGCRIWALPLGFSIGDELVEREYPITWESEKPLTAFEAQTGPDGNPKAVYAVGSV